MQTQFSLQELIKSTYFNTELQDPRYAKDVRLYDASQIFENKTAVYISHRLSSCRFCDRIIVFNDGELIEEGTHDELYNLENGFYANMYKTQAKQYNI